MSGWNGSGVFTRVYNWVSDKASSIKITASRFDSENDNFAAGIQACLTKNGENFPTADLPMNTQKHTAVGVATSRNQYAVVSQVQDGAYSYSAETGAADAYVVTLAPAPVAYIAGMTIRFIAANASTGPSVVDVNGIGAKSIKVGGNSTDTAAGDIAANEVIEATYDGTVFQIKAKPASLEADTRNKIINGTSAFVINQRGDQIGIASGDYIGDRFRFANTSTAVLDGAIFHVDAKDYRSLDVTTADVSIAAGTQCALGQRIEGTNVAEWFQGLAAAETVTLSFKHRHTKTGTYCVAFRNSAADRSYVAEYTQSVSDTEESATITLTLDTTGTWLRDTNTGLRVDFAIAMGSTFHTTADTWQAGNFISTANQVNALDTIGNKFRITDVQLEKGSVATEMECPSYDQVLAACQRYYFNTGAGALVGSRIAISAYGISTTIARTTVAFPVTMRAVPTSLEQSGVATEYSVVGCGAVATVCSAVPTYSDSTTNHGTCIFTVASGLTAYSAGQGATSGVTPSNTQGFLAWSAEL